MVPVPSTRAGDTTGDAGSSGSVAADVAAEAIGETSVAVELSNFPRGEICVLAGADTGTALG